MKKFELHLTPSLEKKILGIMFYWLLTNIPFLRSFPLVQWRSNHDTWKIDPFPQQPFECESVAGSLRSI